MGTGQWIDNKNQIYSQKATSINSHETNFTWIQMGVLSYQGQKYHVLYYQARTGDYKYPLTKVDWVETNKVYIQILDADEYAQLKSIVTKKEGTNTVIETKRDTRTIFFSAGYDESAVLAKISEALQTKISAEDQMSRFAVSSQAVKGQDVVRFLLPEYGLHPDLTQQYFEMPISDFKKLLID